MDIHSTTLSPSNSIISGDGLSSLKQPLLSHHGHCEPSMPRMETHKEETMENQSSQQPLQQAPTGTTFLRTCFNGLNALSGVGILSIPYALSEGGWLSLVFLFIIAVACNYTGLLLKRCMDAHRLVKTYTDIGELAFGYKGRAMVALFMYLELYLVAAEFLILEGDNLEKLFPNKNFQLGSLTIGGKQGFVLVAALLILPTTWLRNLGLLAYVSAGGVLASIIVVGCVAWAGAVDGVGFHESGKLLNWAGLPTAISLYAFCYCGHAVFPTLCTSMKDRSQFPKVLVICFILCTLNYGSMAVLGYLMYGEGLKSQVTLNLPVGKISSKIAIYTTLVNPFTKYAIMITPIAAAIEDWFPFRNSRPISLLIRTVLLISNVVVALTIPFFAYLMAFIGAFLSVVVSLLLPCICYLKIFKSSRSFNLELVIICGILVLGIIVAVLGTYTSLRQIAEHL
ncbi:amino acid transporter AVT1I-like [Telopea speciosissima]|uniref:amino acid transporter AVT1I-like n=1 Tax=Telopea speciosissima TaxID=54955 RepID=UPI001CC74D30|nr:amino acid transporter AVT1I-like [Telopea speciosissima]